MFGFMVMVLHILKKNSRASDYSRGIGYVSIKDMYIGDSVEIMPYTRGKI
jgi:hypothetical protein